MHFLFGDVGRTGRGQVDEIDDEDGREAKGEGCGYYGVLSLTLTLVLFLLVRVGLRDGIVRMPLDTVPAQNRVARDHIARPHDLESVPSLVLDFANRPLARPVRPDDLDPRRKPSERFLVCLGPHERQVRPTAEKEDDRVDEFDEVLHSRMFVLERLGVDGSPVRVVRVVLDGLGSHWNGDDERVQGDRRRERAIGCQAVEGVFGGGGGVEGERVDERE